MRSLTSVTKGQARLLAKQSRRYGHSKHSETEYSVRCPKCSSKVDVYWSSLYSPESLNVAIDTAVVEHLTDVFVGDFTEAVCPALR